MTSTIEIPDFKYKETISSNSVLAFLGEKLKKKIFTM